MIMGTHSTGFQMWLLHLIAVVFQGNELVDTRTGRFKGAPT